MALLEGTLQYFLQHQVEFWLALRQHLELSLAALVLSTGCFVPLGIWIARRSGTAQVVINFFNSLRVLPSLAILFLAIPIFGLGFLPALVALTVLAIPPVLVNTYSGLRGIEPAVVEAAYGMGMTSQQALWRVKLPIAAPVIIAGIRLAAVEVIASATLAAFIGGGGLGDFITRGFALYDTHIMLVGAIPVALLALCAEGLFGIWQRILQASL
jgi:osmoprotectant transport system permease protein